MMMMMVKMMVLIIVNGDGDKDDDGEDDSLLFDPDTGDINSLVSCASLGCLPGICGIFSSCSSYFH